MVFYVTDLARGGALCRKGLTLLSHEEAKLLLTSAGLLLSVYELGGGRFL